MIHPGASAIRRNAMGHGVAELIAQVARNLHDTCIHAIDQTHAQRAASAERGKVDVGSRRTIEGGVEIGQIGPDGGGQITGRKVPLTRDGAGRSCHRYPVSIGTAQKDDLRVREFAGANLDALDPHLTTLVRWRAVGEQVGGRQHGTTSIVQALVGGPIILLDSINVFGHHRGRCRFVVSSYNAMPNQGYEGPFTIVTSAALAELVPLPEEVAIRRTGRLDAPQGRSAWPCAAHHDIHDQRVLVDPGTPAIGSNSVIHCVAVARIQAAGDAHDTGDLTVHVAYAERCGRAELGFITRQTGRSVESRVKILERLSDGRPQVPIVEIPLPRDDGRVAACDIDGEGPIVRVPHSCGVGVAQLHCVVRVRP